MLTMLISPLLIHAGVVDQSSAPPCGYRTVRSVLSDLGVRAAERIRICESGEVSTLDSQVLVSYRINGKRITQLVAQFVSSHGRPFPLRFKNGNLIIHVGRHDRPTFWRKRVKNFSVIIRNDYRDSSRLRFMDVDGRPMGSRRVEM
jgi:hypothetical protein